MSAAEKVAEFLLTKDQRVQQAIARLNFTVDTVRIDPEGYREMGRKIKSGGIKVEEVQRSKDSKVAEVYTSLLDKLSLGPDLKLTGKDASVLHQCGVIHEVTHALIDFHGFNTTNGIEEGVAYVAQIIYAYYFGQVYSSGDKQAQAILDAALDVVRGRKMMIKRGQILSSSDDDVKALVNSVKNHSAAYPDADAKNHANGVFGGSQNKKYKSKTFGK